MLQEPYIYVQKQVHSMRLAVLILFWTFFYTLILIPKIGDDRFKCALWTLKQQLTLKIPARCKISIVLL